MEILSFLALLMLINVIVSLTRKILGYSNKAQVLSCGLVGFCGAGGADMSVIKLLMMYNLSRGSDAAGILIDSSLTKGTDSVDKFLAKNNKLFKKPKEFLKTTTIIGHTRAATAGIPKVLRNAHPFVVKDAESLEPRLYLAMNGSITNMKALDEKYPTNWEYNESDSLHLSLMLWEYKDKRNQILGDYKGAATLLYYHEDEKNTLWVWKDPERPLFYWQKSDRMMYISSIEDSLLAAGAASEDVKSFEDLHIYKIVEGAIVEDKQLFEKTPATPVNNFQRTHAQTRQAANYRDGGHGGAASEVPFQQRPTCEGGKTGEKGTTSQKEVPLFEFGGSSNSDVTRRVVKYQDGLYYVDGNLANGSILCNSKGEIYSSSLDESISKFRRKHFMLGNLLKNAGSFGELWRQVGKTDETANKRYILVDKFNEFPASKLSEHTFLPVQCKGSDTMYFRNGSLLKDTEDFLIRPPFSKGTVHYKGGKKAHVSYGNQPAEDKDYGAISYKSMGFNTDDWKNQLKDHYLKEAIDYYDVVTTVSSDWSVNMEYSFMSDLLMAFLQLCIEAGILSIAEADTYSNFLTNDGGIGFISAEDYKILDQLLDNYKTLSDVDENDVPDGPVDVSVENAAAERILSSASDVFDLNREIENRICSEAVKDPKVAVALDTAEYKTAEFFVKKMFNPTTVPEERIGWNNLAYLLHVRYIIDPDEYKNMTSGEWPLDMIQKTVKNCYSKFLRESVNP